MTNHIVTKCKKCPGDLKQNLKKNTDQACSVSDPNLSTGFVSLSPSTSTSSIHDRRDASGSRNTATDTSESEIPIEEILPKKRSVNQQ